ncbi:MAG: right-handed parallel beta-helix repeat-containing protein [Acidobacteriota bacterium]|nr:right-handed parallel beta-helix repeat-containing protein [Acidobacteriota bacterium]
MTPTAPRYLSAASTDQGFARTNNEDRVHADDVRGIFLVIDGMGGHAAGEQAAGLALERIKTRLERQTGTVEQRIREAITLANNSIHEAAQSRDEWKGMACVLTVAVIENGGVTIGHVGDSRLYRIRRGKMEKITPDHSPVGEREDRGELSESAAMQHPRRNEVYRDVGSQPHEPDDADFIDILNLPFEPDTALLLCSDGLSDVLNAKQMLRIVEQNAGDRWATVRRLIDAANENSKDNVSAVLVEGEKFAASLGKRTRATPGVGEDTARHAPRGSSGGWLRIAAGILLGALGFYAFQCLYPRPELPKPPQTISAGVSRTDFPTIASALGQARPGDTVMVLPGVYSETVRIPEGVQLKASRAREVIIEGGLIAENVHRARVEGVQFRGGSGVRILSSEITLLRCEISRSAEAGIVFRGASTGLVAACSIHDNAGAGIAIEDNASPSIENNVISANGTQPGALQPGLQRNFVVNVITGNVFFGNGIEGIRPPEGSLLRTNYMVGSGKAGTVPRTRTTPRGPRP